MDLIQILAVAGLGWIVVLGLTMTLCMSARRADESELAASADPLMTAMRAPGGASLRHRSLPRSAEAPFTARDAAAAHPSWL